MNQDLTNELAEARAQLEAAKTRIERVEAELAKESKPWEPWKPELRETFFCVSGMGLIENGIWDEHKVDHMHRDFNNCFPTKEAAERHALRLRSMRPTCPVPKVGDEVFVAVCELNGFCADPRTWRDSHAHYTAYLLGRVFTTKEAAEAWIAEFGEAWTTLEYEA